MGSVERCDKTLPLNEMIFHVRRDAALRDKDVRRLHEMGVHQYYVPQILRLFYGAAANANSHPALRAYQQAYPEESARALSLQNELARRGR